MIYELPYLVFCLALAYYNAMRIKQDKRIYHGLNAVGHLICWAVIFLFSRNWHVMICLPFIGRLFFDTALNSFRGLDLGYVADNPKSRIDRIEKFFFREDGLAPKLLYLWITVGINLFPYVKR